MEGLLQRVPQLAGNLHIKDVAIALLAIHAFVWLVFTTVKKYKSGKVSRPSTPDLETPGTTRRAKSKIDRKPGGIHHNIQNDILETI